MRTTWKLILAGIVATMGLQAAVAAPAARFELEQMDDQLAEWMTAGAESAPVIVRFVSRHAVDRTLAETPGLTGIRFDAIPALAFTASRLQIAALSTRGDVAYVELDARIPTLLPTATFASRARAVWDSQDGGPLEVDGRVIDGRGVGIAIVDSGIAGDHPALVYRVAKNFKVIAPGSASGPVNAPVVGPAQALVEMQHSDTTSGHGTHVAAIAAGDGAESGGRAKGSAPGAKLYGFGAGEGLHLLASQAVASFDWILANHDTVTPPIKVVNNSYGNGGKYNPESAYSILGKKLVDEGVTMVWAAGNGDTFGDGGTCEEDLTGSQAKDPTPGVLSVANYSDGESGTRDGALASSSSRGSSEDPSTWPDISAPGSAILSALNPTGAVTLVNKSIDISLGAFGDGNPFGNALNQHDGNVSFRLGGRTSPAKNLNWIIFTEPTATYNAHSDRFIEGAGLAAPDGDEAASMRFFADVPAGLPGVQPRSASAQAVSHGDAIVVEHDGGTGNPIHMQVTSPAGTTKTIAVKFPCEGGCSSEIDLAAHFLGEPADGTWSIAPGPTAGAENVSGDAFNPYYVKADGTSMAAPHVAGIVALLVQADPTITPAEIEEVIEDTAHQFTAGAEYQPDPTNPTTPSSCDKGHGLIDARAAVEQVLN